MTDRCPSKELRMSPWLQLLKNEVHKSLPDVIEVVSFVLVSDWLHPCYQPQTSTKYTEPV